MALKRVILAAENASTRLGGEAILPFHYFRLLLQRGVDVHLVVHARMRSELDQLFADHLDRVHYVRDQRLQKLFYQAGRRVPHRLNEATFGLLNQLLTQRAQRRIISRLATPGSVVHQPIPVAPRFPSLLYDVGAPVVIGPLNGGMEFPPAFVSGSGLKRVAERALLRFGRAFTNTANILLPGKRQAAVIAVANARTAAALPNGLAGKVVMLPENAVDVQTWQGTARTVDSHRFVFIGRLVDWKALDIVLDALATVSGATLDVIGDGPMRTDWTGQAERVGLGARVRWLGWQSQRECAEHLAGAAALLLPSVYECGGAVVLEAMAVARPVVATAWGGPLDYLDARCGILIEPASRAAMVADFAAAMRSLADSPALRESLGTAGRERVLQHFDWDRKLDAMLCIYEQALGDNA